ncbi:ComEC/Rec2 family competence protein [Lichenibacterium dinghuense]|uniref:ComEC/Rec2 family competence protein n=1 Tax=Lichenibacterium dinghuense TaxID=2895977 RepID=UPI001F396882|nr:MBL fold metallo-hydrolase [Lichenibacterium sp. 6Y81]
MVFNLLEIRFLNVGHGSSAVISFYSGNEAAHGVVDSAWNRAPVPKALTVLQNLGATKLSFVCLTHPHADHYGGLSQILQTFDQKIDQFYTCPMGDLFLNRPRLRKLAVYLKQVLARTDSRSIRQSTQEFLQILRWGDSNSSRWIECAGEENRLAPTGFSPVEILSILPPRFAKGNIISRIESEDPMILGNINENDLSLCLRLTYAGTSIIIGGDATKSNWDFRERFERNSGRDIASQVVNIPHHGSKYDNPQPVLDRLFLKSGDRYGVTSANGQSHPHPETIFAISQMGVDPYCTNLMPPCGANVSKLAPIKGVDPSLARLIRESAEDSGEMQPCQGDILVRVTADGVLTVTPEFDAFCSYRRGASARLTPQS